MSFAIDNPCTQDFENINLAGEAYFKGQIIDDGTGVQYLKGHSSVHLSGEDATGIRYVLNEVLNTNNKYPAGAPMTETYSYSIISQGSTDNFHMKVLFHISPNGEVKSEFESVCRG